MKEIKFNQGDRVIVFNKEKNQHEIGLVLHRYRRQKVIRYDIKMERGATLEYVCTNNSNNFYIDTEKTNKFFNQINVIHEQA